MGFGILFVGYMFLLSIPLHSMGICAELIGYLLMLRTLSLLGEYHKGFRSARICVWALLPFGVYSLFLQALSWVGAETLYETLNEVTELPYSILLAVLLMIFHYFLLVGVQGIAADVALPDIVRQAVRNRVVTALYFAAAVFVNFMDRPEITAYMPYMTLVGIVSLFGVVWVLLNAKMIFNCYMWICLPGDEDMPMRESKWPSIFSKKEKPLTEEEQKALEKAEQARKKAEYDAEMRRRQEERTKKNKRGKR